MEIHIIRDGTETGPFTEETVQGLLKEGRVLVTDLAWRPGMSQWFPLMEVLYPAAVPSGAVATLETPLPTPAPALREPASDRQKALLSFLSIPLPSGVTREQAAALLADATEDPKNAARLAKWNTDRFRLYPELFAEEIQERKENRPQQYFEIGETEGAEFFTELTKAHCQVLINYLDVKFPNWDADPKTAVRDYFFPAVADKFPSLLTKAAKGRFKYPEGPKVAAELIQSSPEAVHEKPATSPLAATLRGLCFGGIILIGLWAGRAWLENRAASAEAALADLPASPVAAALELPPERPRKKKNLLAESTPEPVKAPVAEVPAPSPTPVETVVVAAPIPPGPAPEAVATSDLPAAAPGTSVANDLIPPSPVRTTLTLTKPVEFSLAYGRITVPAGTAVKLLQQSGNLVRVGYLDQTALIPASSTDLGTDPAPAAPRQVTASSDPATAPVPAPSGL